MIPVQLAAWLPFSERLKAWSCCRWSPGQASGLADDPGAADRLELLPVIFSQAPGLADDPGAADRLELPPVISRPGIWPGR